MTSPKRPQMPKKSSIYIPQKFPKILIFNGFSILGKIAYNFGDVPKFQYGNLGFEYSPQNVWGRPQNFRGHLKSKKNDIFYMNKNSYRWKWNPAACTGAQEHVV